MPNDNCPLCVAVGEQLTGVLAILEPPFIAGSGDRPDDVRAHALASICSWWITQAMQDPTLGPEAVVRCVANCLAYEHGVHRAVALTQVQLSRTA